MKGLFPRRAVRALVCLASMVSAAGVAAQTCSGAAAAAGWTPPAVRTASTTLDFDAFIDALESRRAVFVGEAHDRYGHHLNQLEVICRLHVRGAALAVGTEFFQQPHQDALDAYVAGNIDIDALLERTEYFTRWGFDFRLYAPILRFARAHRIPLVALNVPSEIIRQVGQGGLDTLSDEERAAWVPAGTEGADEAYRERLREVFEQHPQKQQRSFEHFVQAQLLWDESMAARAARYLRDHPEQRLVVLAGEGHIAFGSGIPARVARRIDLTLATVLQSDGESGRSLPREAADYHLRAVALGLPAPGRLGVIIESDEAGVVIRSLSDDSAARAAGLAEGDRLVAVAGREVEDFNDVKIALWEKRPGERVTVRAERPGEGHILERRVRLR